ncbi:MAG TPA: 4-hydroxyphenylacetate 3-hydroxylase N-terminal domain-containing protein [Ilumatobacteraceae bacterium]
MGARTGDEYITGLKDDRTVWLDGRKVDVVGEPRFAGSLTGIAEYFDYQHRHADDCLVEDRESGERINASHLIPLTDDDLRRRHRALDRLARYSIGMLGRTPDYVNVTVAGFVAQRRLFEKNGDVRAGAALTAFQRDVALRDLALTHTIINPVIDKSVGDVEGINAQLAPRIIRRTEDGIVVSGSKILGTLGPFADENFVYPAHPLPKDADPDYALCFSVPVGAKGLHTVCRDHYGVEGTRADHPFSSRFDEQDAFLIFDEVEVPWERVFIAGDLDVYGNVMKHGWAANVIQQTALRAAVKLEFAYDLAFKMVEVQNMGGRAEATQLLGELVTYADMTRTAIRAAEAGAHEYKFGGWFCASEPFTALRSLMPSWMTRVSDIFKTLGSHNLLCTPNEAAFADPELGPLVRRYLPGANDISAEERAKIFRMAWDFAGSALGSRSELYERFYLASQPRNMTGNHMIARSGREWTDVDDFREVSGIV